jgi:spermidine synthase
MLLSAAMVRWPLLFFVSGVSGLIYQVIWVRQFGNLFGNTVFAASLVIAVFMSGLGVGSYVAGIWADRRYLTRPNAAVRAFGYSELAIGAMGFALLVGLGWLDDFPAGYTRNAVGWFVPSWTSHAAQYALTILLLGPITALMGGTLTLLIRHLLQQDVTAAGWKIGALYGMNTAGAAIGCFLTDYALIPQLGLRLTEALAVLLNLAVGSCVLFLTRHTTGAPVTSSQRQPPRRRDVTAASATPTRVLVLVAAAIFLTGFAAMGMEILWFRHISALVGPFRSVYSLLTTVILLAMGAGAILSGFLATRVGHPLLLLIASEALFLASTAFGFWSADIRQILSEQSSATSAFVASSGWAREQISLGLISRPLLREVALPALFMGAAYPLATATIAHLPAAVGRRAGAIYLANTVGAVAGSIVAAFLLMPTLGLQASAGVMFIGLGIGTILIVAAWMSSPGSRRSARRGFVVVAASTTVAAMTMIVWLRLPADYITMNSLPPLREHERRLHVEEGVTETVMVTEVTGEGRRLITNSYAMSATLPDARRYMRALAHIPLLSMEAPERVLVIGFGVGNTLHAASLYPSVHTLEIADLSENVLRHAAFFAATNGNVMASPRLAVYVNDGRHHLTLQPAGTYDLVTLEPPPLAAAGVASLYSKEFYQLARSRLKPGGYLTQWLPAYQVPAETTLAMVRAFLDVFPASVLLSGYRSELILMGTTGRAIEVDPVAVLRRMHATPELAADLEHNFLGTLTEVIGTFTASADTLARATASTAPETDDHPVQEYAVHARLRATRIPASLFDVDGLAAWCPKCFRGNEVIPTLQDLPGYLTILDRLYRSTVFLEPNHPAPPPLRLAGDHRVSETIERNPYLALLFSVRSVQ